MGVTVYEVIQVVGTLLGIAVPVWGVTIWILRRLKFPENELWFELTSTPVLNVRPPGVVVEIDGHRLEDPYAVTLHVWSTGTADMPSTAFDNGVPITLRLDRPMLGEITTGGTKKGSSVIEQIIDDRAIAIGPGLARKDYRATWSFVTDGIAAVEETHTLFGATLQSAARAEQKDDRRSARLSGVGIFLILAPLVVLLVSFVVGIFAPNDVRALLSDWVILGFLSVGAGFGLLAAVVSVPSRWARALKKRGTSRFAKYNGDPFNPTERYHSS